MKIPYEYQTKAINAVYEYMIEDDEDKCVLSMCPRSGKSFIAQQIIGKFNNKLYNNPLYVYFVPTLELLRQIIKDLVNDFKETNFDGINLNPEFIAIGSTDHIKINDIQKIPTIHGTEVTSKLLEWHTNFSSNLKIIACTYDSSDKLINFIKNNDIQVSCVFYDEAHYLTYSSPSNKSQQKNELENQEYEEKIELNKYLRTVSPDITEFFIKQIFLTGTPTQVLFGNKMITDKNIQTEYSMDNVSNYGEIAFKFSFQDALKFGKICNFDVITPIINNIDEYNDNLGKITEGILLQKDYLRIVSDFVNDCFNQYPIKHLLIYVNNSKKAVLLEKLLKEVLNDTDININAIYTGKVDGKYKNKTERDKCIQEFKKSKRSILINIDIISVGVTMKEIDSVLFAEEINSESLIVQRIFRCLTYDNEYPEKKGRILIPCASFNDENNVTITPRFKKINEMISRIKQRDENWCYKKISIKLTRYENDDEPIPQTIQLNDDDIDIVSNNNKNEIIKKEVNKFYESNFKSKVSNHSHIYQYSLRYFKDFLKELNINNIEEYKIWINNKDIHDNYDDKYIFGRPDKWYINEWVCWDDVFENETKYGEYEYTKNLVHEIVKEKNINSVTNYLENYELLSNIQNPEINKIKSIPLQPSKFYIAKNDLWKGWSDYLGINIIDEEKIEITNNSNTETKLDNNLKNFVSKEIKILSDKILSSETWINNIDKDKFFSNDINSILIDIKNNLELYKSISITNFSCNINKKTNNNIKFILIKLWNNNTYYCGIQIKKNCCNLSPSAVFSCDYEWRDKINETCITLYNIISTKYYDIKNK